MDRSRLFNPLPLGPLLLSHRLALAPLTRFRASDDHVPLQPMVSTYYAQRACLPGTLLITEATFVSPQASGYANVPGLWTDAQLASWRRVTDAVHARGGVVFVQLWALGRAASARELAKKGLRVVAPSAVPIAEGREAPEAMSEEQVLRTVGEYAGAAGRAVREGGFDGVEIHGANGYLVDQFSQSVSNTRTDRWGGSVENRARFALEVAKAVSREIGPERTGIRLSPYSEFQGMRMPTEEAIRAQFTYLIAGLKALGLVYLHMTTPRVQGGTDVKNPKENLDWAIRAWGPERPLLLAGGYRPKTAAEEVDVNYPEYNIVVAFGRPYISNPDLPFRIKRGIELARYDRETFYTAQSEKGYVDYPFSDEFVREQGAEGESRL